MNQSFTTVVNSVPARKYFCILALFSFIICFSGLLFDGIVSGDETRTAGITTAMYLNGNAVVPYLGNMPFLEYPPLFYWISCGSVRLFGLNDTALKLPVALMAFGSVLLVFFSARKLKLSPFESFLAGFMMLSSSQFLSNALQYRTDMALAFFLMVSLSGYLTSLSAAGFRQKAASWIVMACGLACAIMTKGPIGLAVAASGIGVFVAADDILARKFRISRWLFPLSAGIASLIPLAVWIYLLYCEAGPQAVHTVLIFNTVGRIQTTADHAEPFYYYLLKLPGLFQPWLVFLLAGLVLAFRRIRREKDSSALLMVSLILVPFLLFSCASGKRTVYLLSICGFCTFPAAQCLLTVLRILATGEYKHKILLAVQKKLPVIWHWLPIPVLVGIFTICMIKGGWFFLLLVPGILTSVCAFICWKTDKGKASLFTGIAWCFLLASANGAIMQYRVKEDSVRAFYLEAGRVAEKENRALFFYPEIIQERMAGSLYYYLLRTAPGKENYDGISKELWLSRIRGLKGGTDGNDNHRFHRMPEDLSYFPELKK